MAVLDVTERIRFKIWHEPIQRSGFGSIYMGYVFTVISGASFKMLFIQIEILNDYDPDRPSSQGSPRSSNRVCSAV